MASSTDAPRPPRAPDSTDTELAVPRAERGFRLADGHISGADLTERSLSEGRISDVILRD